MTSFRELLRDIADQAQPIDDLAENALQRPRRSRGWPPHRRMMPIALAAAASVALVLSLTVVGVRLLDDAGQPSSVPLTMNGGATTVHFPESAPPLPDKGVGSVLLSYRMTCKDADGNERDCDRWRVMTPDGKHYEVEGPADPENAFGPGLLVSPDGHQIAYLREDGAFVARDLDTGQTTILFEWDSNAVYADMFSFAWSPDGRWLLAVPGEEACPPADDGNGCRLHYLDEPSVLVDTERVTIPSDPGQPDKPQGAGFAKSIPLGDGTGGAYGLPAGDRPFPFDGVGGASDGLPLVDHSGEVVGEIPNELMPGQQVDGKLANISPDGSTLPVITFPKDKASNADGGRPLITIVDVENQEILRDFRIERSWKVWDSPNFVGWLDDSTVLIQTYYLKRHIPLGPDYGAPVNIDALDVETGELHRVLRFPDLPAGLHIASDLL